MAQMRLVSIAYSAMLCLAVGCTPDDSESSCDPEGNTASCDCDGGAVGERTCGEDGSWSGCVCGSASGPIRDAGREGDAGLPDADVSSGVDESGERPVGGPFIGEFDCDFSTESFAGDQSSGMDTTPTQIDGIESAPGVLEMRGVVGTHTPFEACPVLWDLDGMSASLQLPQGCDRVAGLAYSEGSAEADGDGGFTAHLEGNVTGAHVVIDLDCWPGERLTADNGSDFLGDWQCSGTNNTAAGETRTVSFSMQVLEQVGGEIRLSATDSSAGPLIMCPGLFHATSAQEAQLVEGQTCAQTFPGTPESSGLYLEGASLVGDYTHVMVAANGEFRDELTFECSR